jgi:hypothetical protein
MNDKKNAVVLEIVDSGKRPVIYDLKIMQTGRRLEYELRGVGGDAKSRESVADALRAVANDVQASS